MFTIPGFNVGNLVVEAPKEQLKKRKHDAVQDSTTTVSRSLPAATTSTTTSSGKSSSTQSSTVNTSSSSVSTTTSASTSVSHVPSSKRVKKNHLATPSTSDTATPSSTFANASSSGTVALLKERDSWNRSTKALRKAKAQEAAQSKKNKDDGDVTMKNASDQKGGDLGEQSKKRNKRLERKIKKAAYIAAMEEAKKQEKGNTSDQDEHTAKNTDNVNTTKEAPKSTVRPELAKLTNKEKRLLKQFQKKKQEEGVDLAAVASEDLLSKPSTNGNEKKISKKTKPEEGSATTNKKSKKEKTVAAPSTVNSITSKETSKKEKKTSNETSKKQQQLVMEKEKLLEALSRTNNALEELQMTLGEGNDDASMTKAQVKAAVKKNKKEKETKEAKESAPTTPSTQPKLTKLQEQMRKTLAGGKFRFLNEQLYTTTGEEAFELFQSKPELFDEYHEGFRSQVESWPQNPVDLFISQLRQMPKETIIADMGCGDAQISMELGKKYKVLSFDLIAKNDRVTACDIAQLPLEDASIDVAIFCLSLMGTDFLKFLKEAFRVLKPKGQLKIAEVISRFTDVDAFVEALKTLGFELKRSDASNKMFIMFDFIKPDPSTASSSKKGSKGSKKKGPEDTPTVDMLDGSSLLKPCIYKKR